MKRSYHHIKIASFVILVVLVTVAGNLFIRAVDQGKFEKELIPDYTAAVEGWQDIKGPLLTTHWKQDSSFARFTPGNALLGCWSVAFAQVLAFHGLQANGSVSYLTSNNVQINEELVQLDLKKVLAPQDSCDLPWETARYCYQTAVVLQKDFGWGDYMDISRIPADVSEHFRCKVLKRDTDLPGTIIREISSGRPVVAFFDDILAIKIVTNGHAAVIDGTGMVNDKLLVHLNAGWGGKSDGWYDFGTLSTERGLKYVFTVR